MYRVLLVDDDAAIRFIYRKMKTWSDSGFVIADEASNGKEALRLISENQYDLIFTDIKMPFIDGIELLRMLKETDHHAIVVFSSSYNEFEYARQGIILGAFDYILKPVTDKQLEKVLERVREKLFRESSIEQIDNVVETVFIQLDIELGTSRFVFQCANYFSQNYRNGFTMEEMAAFFGFSKDYFGKLFKQHFGMTFHKFLNALKISYAKSLIQTGNYKAYEISDKLGFSSVDYFTKIFRETTGMTPSAYKTSIA